MAAQVLVRKSQLIHLKPASLPISKDLKSLSNHVLKVAKGDSLRVQGSPFAGDRHMVPDVANVLDQGQVLNLVARRYFQPNVACSQASTHCPKRTLEDITKVTLQESLNGCFIPPQSQTVSHCIFCNCSVTHDRTRTRFQLQSGKFALLVFTKSMQQRCSEGSIPYACFQWHGAAVEILRHCGTGSLIAWKSVSTVQH